MSFFYTIFVNNEEEEQQDTCTVQDLLDLFVCASAHNDNTCAKMMSLPTSLL